MLTKSDKVERTILNLCCIVCASAESYLSAQAQRITYTKKWEPLSGPLWVQKLIFQEFNNFIWLEIVVFLLFATAVHGRLLRNHAQAAFAALSACAESYLYPADRYLGPLSGSYGSGIFWYRVFGHEIVNILAAIISCVLKDDMMTS